LAVTTDRDDYSLSILHDIAIAHPTKARQARQVYVANFAIKMLIMQEVLR